MRKFIIWFFSVAILLVIGMIAAYLLAKKYEEPVRNYIVKQVNHRLQSPVHVSDINFSFLERFPSASLVMDSVWAEENIVKLGEPDTLFFFRKVFLNLDLIGILQGQYRIDEIEAKDGFMRLMVDDEGFDNYHIWKESDDTTGFLLELDKVHINNGYFRFTNQLRNQYYGMLAEDLYFNGRFSDESYTMQVDGNGLIEDINITGTSYLRNRHVEIETDLDVITADERYAFRKGEVTIDDRLSFTLSGAFVKDGIDLKVKGEQLDIIQTLSLIPTESKNTLEDYKSSGILTFDCTLKGAFGKTENPDLMMNFSFKNASISRKGSDWSLSELDGSGSLSNGSQRSFASTTLIIDELHGKLNDDPFQTRLSVSDFTHPLIEGEAQLQSSFQGLKDFFNLDQFEVAEGAFVLDAKISAKLDDPENPKPEDFLNAKASGFLRISKANLKLKQDDRRYTIDTAAFSIDNNTLEIDLYEGFINQSRIEAIGVASGFLDYFFTPDGVMDIEGRISTGAINLNELFPSEGEGKSGVALSFPKRTRWNLEIIAEAFNIGSFRADEISGRLVMNPFKVEASQLHFRSQDGDIQGKAGVYRFGSNQFGIKTNFQTSDVDIKQLFTTFNNFNQQFITAEVLEGRLDAEINFQSLCDSLLNINTESIIASGDVKISDGGLMHFKPLIDIADEVKKKPMLRLFIATDELRKRLETVRFATLENEISIRNGVITIPSMAINSTALNLNVSGTHTFKNEIDYELDFALNEVLALKDRKEPYNEFVSRDDAGRTRLYLALVGTTEDYEVTIKRTDLKKTVKSEIADEKHEVKRILKEEFGAFSNDTTIRNGDGEQKMIDIEFDPEQGSQSKTDEPSKRSEANPKEKDKNLFNKLMKKTESNKKELRDGEFEDDDF